jgi:hypothetical protein
MTPKEAFKYAFLLRCAEEGLTADEAEARAARGLEKHAEGGLMDTFGKGLISNTLSGAKDFVMSAPGTVAGWAGSGLGLAGLGLAGAGALGGYGLAKMQEGDVDPGEVQREELIAAYRTQAELARRKAIMDAVHRAQPRPRSYHGI